MLRPGPAWSAFCVAAMCHATDRSRRRELRRRPRSPTAAPSDVMVLMAQSVPVAVVGPVRRRRCRPAGSWAACRSHEDEATLLARLGPGRQPRRRGDACAARRRASWTAPTEVPSDEPGMRRFEQPEQLPPDLRSTRTTSSTAAASPTVRLRRRRRRASLMFDADSALAFQPRAELVDEVRRRTGLRLCGAGAPRAREDRDGSAP